MANEKHFTLSFYSRSFSVYCIILVSRSINTVMSDLRLLEEQQREAQRKVANVKISKQRKAEQQEKVEQNLASLRYSNAQQREQLERCRQILSVQTHEFGTIKLRSTTAADDLKRFDDKLRAGLQVLQSLMRYHRIIETKIVHYENSSAILARLRAESEKKLQTAKGTLENCERQENLVAKAIQTDKSEARSLSEEVLRVRSITNELEQDLTIATQMEMRTKISLETKKTDIEADEKRRKQVTEDKRVNIIEKQSRKKEIENKMAQKKSLMEEKSKELSAAKEKCRTIQKEEGCATRDGCSALDTTLMQLRMEEEERAFVEEAYRRDSLRQNIEKLEKQSYEAEERANADRQVAEARNRKVEEGTVAESERSARYQSLCTEVEKVNTDAVKVSSCILISYEVSDASQANTGSLPNVFLV